jgi:DNA-binding NtrC family response regulator
MPRSRQMTDALAELLDAAQGPIYVLDDARRIVFCNRSLSAWTGVRAADLVGRRVDYHSRSAAEGPPGVAAGLCPPPAALAGAQTVGHVSCMSSDGRLLHRRARFVPLPEAIADTADLSSGVVVFVAPVDREADDLTAADADELSADELHLRIHQFRVAQAHRYDVDRLVGSSPAAQRARAQVHVAAGTDAAVLVVGSSGSGCGHVARAIHYQSDSSRQTRLVPLSCEIQSADVLRQTYQSLTSRASGDRHGTLLLEHADAMSVELQTQLATLSAAERSPIRLLSTAQRNLDALATAGTFRRDLACMLSTITIELCPLSERIDDLPILIQLLLEDSNQGPGKQIAGVSPEALDLLAGHEWPGGIDELAQVIQSAHRAAEGHELRVHDLPARIRQATEGARHPRREEETIVLDKFLARIEDQLIRRALARAKGNKAQAARLLGMTRPRLYRRLVQLDRADKTPSGPVAN